MSQLFNYRWMQLNRRKCQHHWLPLIIGMISTLVVLGLWQQLLIQEQSHIDLLVQQEADAIEVKLNRELTTRISALERMASRWEISAGTPEPLWEADAADLVKDFYGYQAIEWVDSSFRARWVVPLKGNETVPNFDLSQEKRRRITLQVARNLNQTLLTQTITLVQGGKGFLACVPLFLRSGEKTLETARFDGFIVGVFRFQWLFDSILKVSPRYKVQVFDRNGLIYSQGSSAVAMPSKTVGIKAYSLDWQVRVIPTPELIAEERSLFPAVVLWGGLAIVWTLALVVYLRQSSLRQARWTKQINQQLQDEIIHRQQVEASLRASEERWQLALRGNNDGIWDWNIKTAQVFFSNRWKKMLGYEEYEIGTHLDEWERRVHPDDLAATQEAIANHLARKTPFYISEHRVRCKDGSYKWILDRGQALWDKEGRGIRMVGSYTDITERKQAEIALKESEAKYRNLVKYLNAGIVIHAPDTNIMQCNTTACKILGLSMEQLLGREKVTPEWNFLREDGTIMPAEEYPVNRVLATQAPIENYVVGVNQENRSRVWLLVTAFPEFDDNYQVKQIVVTFIDISRLKQAETDLRDLAAVMENAVSGISKLDAQGRYVYVNKAYADMTGYEPEEMINMLWQQTIDVSDSKQMQKAYLQMIRDNIIEVETKGIRKDGSCFYKQLVMVAAYDEQHQFVGHYCCMKDISDRKHIEVERQRAEENLRHQKEMLQAIVNHIPVMIALFNSNGRVEYVNPELTQVLGWTLEDWQQCDVLAECYPDPADYQKVVAHISSVDGQWKDFTTLTKSKQKIETTWTNIALSDGSNLGIGQDISDRKNKEIILRQAMEAAEAANMAKSVFLANMSHELRTPLNVILGFAQVMAHDESLSANQQEDLQTIQRSGDHLLSLINEVLDLSKIEAGHCTLEKTGFDLISLLHELHRMMTERAKAKKLQLQFEIAPEVPQFIVADEQKLRQVLLNLLSNAIKFTNQGNVTLRVNTAREKSSSIEAKTYENKVVLGATLSLYPVSSTHVSALLQFEVIDTGVGIAYTELHTIFDAFTQAEAGKKSVSGTGLGLTISRKLLELMQGEITVQSVPNVGSTFTVTIPVHLISSIENRSETYKRSVTGLVPGQACHRILVVDDQHENRLLMVRLLSLLELEVREAVDGQDAVAICREWQPDLIWMDIQMPGLDGYEASQQIRAMEQEKNSVIIALTAQASHSDRALALAAGCNDYISKPFQEDIIFRKMAEYLGLEYLYADSESPLPLPLKGLQIADMTSFIPPDPSTLMDVPTEWLRALEEAAICGNDRMIVELTTHLSSEFAPLSLYLRKLANQFEFEQIIRFIDRCYSS